MKTCSECKSIIDYETGVLRCLSVEIRPQDEDWAIFCGECCEIYLTLNRELEW
jgi:Zn finger protein HypA/HybF involved in hydrogenase expression